MKTDKAKKLAIAIEHLANDACENILNVKTKTISQTANRDNIARQLAFVLYNNVASNRKAVEKPRNKEVSEDYALQFEQANDDYVAMANAYKIINKRFPRKERKTPDQLVDELFV